MKKDINRFRGEAPILSSKSLQDNQAAFAENADLRRGLLEPARACERVGKVLTTGAKTLYWFATTDTSS